MNRRVHYVLGFFGYLTGTIVSISADGLKNWGWYAASFGLLLLAFAMAETVGFFARRQRRKYLHD